MKPRIAFLTTLLSLTYPLFAAPPSTRPAAADHDIESKTRKLLTEWRDKFNAEHLNYTLASPFVIAGDASPTRLRQYRDNTVLASMRALRATFFTAPPDEPVLILLFENEGPYKRLAKKWFDEDDVPHFGFFRRADHAMLMNVGTGTGTLVHELTHALMAPDFPDVPDWFNEGLASLFEQCSLSGDTITGHENWRLPALQDAIRKRKLRPLEEMIADKSFYDEKHVGLNYAQARYLMFYLQEKGLLKDFYRRFRDHAKTDPTGVSTLKQVLKVDELKTFDATWRKWVLTLRFG